MQLNRTEFPEIKQYQYQLPAGKVMMDVFFDPQVFLYFKEPHHYISVLFEVPKKYIYIIYNHFLTI